MPPLHHVSASQVEMFRRCPRLWFFQYVKGIKTPASPAMARGTEIHALMEKWGATGALPSEDHEWYPLVKEAVAAMELEVPKREDLILEAGFNLDTIEGGPLWTGYIDVLDPNGSEDPGEKYDCRVHDYKTLSDFRYAKTPEEIRTNVQMLSYAKFCTTQEASVQRVAIGHVYMRTKKPARVNMPPPVIVERSYVEDQYASFCDKEVRAMSALAIEAPDVLEVTPNTSACNDYGGCFFRTECGFLPSLFQIGGPKKESGSMSSSFAEKLKLKMNGAAVPLLNPPPDLTPRVAAEVAATPSVSTDVCGKCKGTKSYQTEDGSFFLCTACSGKPRVAASTPSSIIPPDAPSRETKLPEPLKAEATEAAPKKRGRPKKETTVEAKITEPMPETNGAVLPTVQEKVANHFKAVEEAKEVTPLPTTRKTPTKAPTIYIDTFVVKGSAPRPVPFEEWLSPIAEAVADENKVLDYRLISYTSKGMLGAAIQMCLDKLPEYIFVDSRLSGAEVFLEAVIPHAKEVVRAIR